MSAHIPGAISIPVEEIASRARELLPDRAAEIVVYCGNLPCERSAQAASQLHELGYSNVRDYREDLADWIESAGPTESAAPREADPTVPISSGPPLLDSPGGALGRGPARVSTSMDAHVLRLIEQHSTLQLFLIWLGSPLAAEAGYRGRLSGRDSDQLGFGTDRTGCASSKSAARVRAHRVAANCARPSDAPCQRHLRQLCAS